MTGLRPKGGRKFAGWAVSFEISEKKWPQTFTKTQKAGCEIRLRSNFSISAH
jgi:hypothetical protein